MANGKWSEETRQLAITKFSLTNSFAIASKETGVPESTIRDWVKATEKDGKSIVEIRERNKERFVRNAWRLISKLQDSIEKDLEKADSGHSKVKISAKDKAIIMATLYDKQALIAKEPTEIIDGEVKMTKFEDL